MNIAVYCSANDHLDPDFYTLTDELGRFMAQEGHHLVFGGANMGLMERIAKAVKDNGGMTIGVVPQILEKGGRVSNYLDVEIPCDSLADRKELMETKSDIFIALPGGVGTLDEIFNVVASATIGYHHKRVILYNMKGFWDQLIALLDDLAHRGCIRGDWHSQIVVANNLDDIRKALQS